MKVWVLEVEYDEENSWILGVVDSEEEADRLEKLYAPWLHGHEFELNSISYEDLNRI